MPTVSMLIPWRPQYLTGGSGRKAGSAPRGTQHQQALREWQLLSLRHYLLGILKLGVAAPSHFFRTVNGRGQSSAGW